MMKNEKDARPCKTCGAMNFPDEKYCSNCETLLETVTSPLTLSVNQPFRDPSFYTADVPVRMEMQLGATDEETVLLPVDQFAQGRATVPIRGVERPVVARPLTMRETGPTIPHPISAFRKLKTDKRVLLWAIAGTGVIALLLVFSLRALLDGGSSGLHVTTAPAPKFPKGIGVFQAPNGESIGISDGSYVFDVGPDRPDSSLKTQASASLKNGDRSTAIALWEQAVAEDSNDAESLIYLEDQHVLGSGLPYITFVLGTSFATPLPNYSNRDILQGAYVAQKEYNTNHPQPGQTQVFLLIAKSGSVPVYTVTIAQQVVQAAKRDKHIVGVLGWATSARALEAYPIFTQAEIPMVSHSSTGDTLTNASPYFFRIVPPNSAQASAGARYASQTLHADKVVAFEDSSDEANVSSVNDFIKQFKADGHQVVKVEDFKTGKHANFPQLLADAEKYKPDLLYMPATSPYDTFVMLELLPTTGPFALLDVLSGDAAYSLVSTPAPAINVPNFNRLRFTSLSNPDIWNYLGYVKQTPAFFSEYARTFDPAGQNLGRYGFSRPDAYTMLSYDVMQVFLISSAALLAKQQEVTPQALKQQLEQVTGSNASQGVAGQITFGANHDPIDKTIVVLRIDQYGFTQIDDVEGCFLKGCVRTYSGS